MTQGEGHCWGNVQWSGGLGRPQTSRTTGRWGLQGAVPTKTSGRTTRPEAFTFQVWSALSPHPSSHLLPWEWECLSRAPPLH